MSLMRYLWVESARGGDGALIPGHEPVKPDYAKAAPEQINGWYFDMFNVSKEQLQETATHGAVGVYMAGNWAEVKGKPGPEIAEVVDAKVRELSWGTTNKP